MVLAVEVGGHGGEGVAVAGWHSISSQAAIEILATMEIVAEDRPDLFISWLAARTCWSAGKAPCITDPSAAPGSSA
jgi:hypothetical protein